jgi:hypothetical protein
MDSAKESDGGFIVSCGNGPEWLKFRAEVLNQGPRLVPVSVAFRRFRALRFRRNDGFDAGFLQQCQPALFRVVDPIGKKRRAGLRQVGDPLCRQQVCNPPAEAYQQQTT